MHAKPLSLDVSPPRSAQSAATERAEGLSDRRARAAKSDCLRTFLSQVHRLGLQRLAFGAEARESRTRTSGRRPVHFPRARKGLPSQEELGQRLLLEPRLEIRRGQGHGHKDEAVRALERLVA